MDIGKHLVLGKLISDVWRRDRKKNEAMRGRPMKRTIVHRIHKLTTHSWHLAPLAARAPSVAVGCVSHLQNEDRVSRLSIVVGDLLT